MTREIEEKASNYMRGRAMALSFKPLSLQDVKEAYLCGAEDYAHISKPTNPWHKASEELPEVPEKKKYIKVLTTLPHGSGYDFRILYFHKDFGFSKHKEYQNAYYKDRKTGCVHWMYIPEIKEERK